MILRDAFGPNGSVRDTVERHEVGSGQLYTWRQQAMSGTLAGSARKSVMRASTLTKRNDLLVFTSDQFTIGVHMAPLFDMAKLKKRDLTAFVDAKGLHIRWTTGGLNLRPRTDAGADRIVMSLPTRAAALAA